MSDETQGPTLPPEEPEEAPTRAMDQDSRPGRMVGPYRLLQRLGAGGMGEVWEAEQQRPVRRRVALKLIKFGMDTEQVVARFESERQALALMDHPAIARVFDAGATAEGRPYFVMELVRGIPLTLHCDTQRLTTRERLELFIQVCEGVQHAHQKAIIHRDLKPSNVLVAIQDGKPVPKIIDFGVAKATAQRLTERTMFTEMGQMIGTPEYMSPEQAEMSAQDIDTRSDVYSLGVILYELLAGALPFDSRELRQSGFDEIRRRIREVDPPRPSTRVGTLGERAATVSEQRRTEPTALNRQLRGDLDWIIMKALEKDRTRRYGSPAELAADIRRYLGNEPVIARPPSAAYRLQKFVRRHTFGVTAAAILVVLLVAFAATMAVQARRIATERDRANREAEAATQVSQFLTDLFKVSDPGKARGNSVTAREILDEGADRIKEQLADQPTVQARLMDTMGEVYSNLGLYDEAAPLLEEALATHRTELGPEDPVTLRTAQKAGILAFRLGRLEEAKAFFDQALQGRVRVLGPDHPESLDAMNSLATFYMIGLRDYDRAEPLYVDALEGQRRILGDEHPDTLKTMSNLAILYQLQGKLDAAEPLAAEAFASRRRLLGPDHPVTLNSMQGLANLYGLQGRLDEAQPLFEESLAIRKRIQGEDHPETLTQANNLAEVYRLQGKLDEAESLMRTTLALQRRVLGNEHPNTMVYMDTMASIYSDMGRRQEAERLYLEALENRTRLLGAGHPSTVESLEALAGFYQKGGDPDQAGHYTARLEEARRLTAGAREAAAGKTANP